MQTMAVERIEPQNCATVWEKACSKPAQSPMMVPVRSARSRSWKKRRGRVRSFSASVMRRRSLS